MSSTLHREKIRSNIRHLGEHHIKLRVAEVEQLLLCQVIDGKGVVVLVDDECSKGLARCGLVGFEYLCVLARVDLLGKVRHLQLVAKGEENKVVCVQAIDATPSSGEEPLGEFYG